MEPLVFAALALIALIILALVGLVVIIIMGHVYMTSLAFNHTKSGDDRTYALKDWQMHTVKIAAAFFWVNLAIQLFAGVRAAVRGPGVSA